MADYIQSELQLKAGRDKGDLHELDGSPLMLLTNTVFLYQTKLGKKRLLAFVNCGLTYLVN